MSTQDLDQIRKIIREETVSKEELKTELQASENRIKTELRAEFNASEERLSQTTHVLTEDMAEFFHKTWELIEKNEQNLTQRVEQIEDHLGLTDPTKNN